MSFIQLTTLQSFINTCFSLHRIQTRPLDLPENSVSVFKIRQELENGRRLSTAMKNNHVDFVALDNILKNVTETTGKTLAHTHQYTLNYSTVSFCLKKNDILIYKSLQNFVPGSILYHFLFLLF